MFRKIGTILLLIASFSANATTCSGYISKIKSAADGQNFIVTLSQYSNQYEVSPKDINVIASAAAASKHVRLTVVERENGVGGALVTSSVNCGDNDSDETLTVDKIYQISY